MYEGLSSDIWNTFVGTERYLRVTDMKLNRNRDRLVYQGQRDDGWRQVVDGLHSDPFTKISRATWTRDGYGLYFSATHPAGASLVRKDHDQSYKKHSDWKSLPGNYDGTPVVVHYSLPFVIGKVRPSEQEPERWAFVDDVRLPKNQKTYLGFGWSKDSLSALSLIHI